jgi:hypothetical protein
MRHTRRKFIIGSGAALVGSALERTHAQTPSNAPTSPDIRSVLVSSGFNPDAPDSVLLAVIGDTHLVADPDTPIYNLTLDDSLVAELNGLSPAITDLVFAGDLITSWSVAMATPRWPNTYTYAHREFQAAKQEMSRFRQNMRIWSVPGNHDTDREETDAELWRTDLGTPPYQLSVLGGVPVFFLNSGHAGMLNDGQRAWFESEVRKIAAEQEVLIIAHHPSFFMKFVETGLKRIVSEAFAKHQAPVWLAGGHTHQFGEALLVAGPARFIQMAVTAGNPRFNGDGKAPGYILLGLQGGRVVTRIFRSLSNTAFGFNVRPPLAQLPPSRIEWPFDEVAYPVALYNEGFYDRSGKLVNYSGIDLKGHFTYCKIHTVRVDLSRTMGKVTRFLLSAQIPTNLAAPILEFSTSGSGGPWTDASIVTPNGNAVYRIPIPEAFRNAANLHIRTRTQAQGTWDGINIYGWGLEADASMLTGYEKWILLRYGTFLLNEQTDPAAIPAGYSLPNLVLFAFNMAPVTPTSPGAIAAPLIQGMPAVSIILAQDTQTFRFARRKSATNPGISYVVEESSKLEAWNPVDAGRLVISPLDETWEEVRLAQPVENGFFRVRLEQNHDPLGTFLPWRNAISIHGAPESDRNANNLEDLVEYAFDLPSSGAIRPYDPDSAIAKPGLPNIGKRFNPMTRIEYARMRQDASPGISYTLEQSVDLENWTEVPAANISTKVVQTAVDWEKVECLVNTPQNPTYYFRVKIELSQPLSPQA